MAAWRASGKSVPVFAAEHGLASSSLYQWIHPPKKTSKTGQSGKKGRRKASPKSSFAEVNVVGQARGPAMTVALRGSHSVTFEGGPVDPAWLASVLRVVSAC